MTTPHQPAPAGAYQIGGGDFRFGQDMSETYAKSLWEVPAVNLGNMLDLLRKYLLEAPIEALQGMLSFIPGFAGDIASAVDIVGHILGTLVDNATVALTKIVNQITDIFNGLVVTPINGAIQGIKDWFDALFGGGGGTPSINVRVGAITSSPTPTVNTDAVDQFNITALAVDISSMTSGLTGTPQDGQLRRFRFKDNGSPRTVTWGPSFTGNLLTTTVTSMTHIQEVVWDAAKSKWAGTYNDAAGY